MGGKINVHFKLCVSCNVGVTVLFPLYLRRIIFDVERSLCNFQTGCIYLAYKANTCCYWHYLFLCESVRTTDYKNPDKKSQSIFDSWKSTRKTETEAGRSQPVDKNCICDIYLKKKNLIYFPLLFQMCERLSRQSKYTVSVICDNFCSTLKQKFPYFVSVKKIKPLSVASVYCTEWLSSDMIYF